MMSLDIIDLYMLSKYRVMIENSTGHVNESEFAPASDEIY